MTSEFYFTATSWFPGNVRVKPHSKHSAPPPHYGPHYNNGVCRLLWDRAFTFKYWRSQILLHSQIKQGTSNQSQFGINSVIFERHAGTYLQLPLFTSYCCPAERVNIAENPVAVMGLLIRSGHVIFKTICSHNVLTLNLKSRPRGSYSSIWDYIVPKDV